MMARVIPLSGGAKRRGKPLMVHQVPKDCVTLIARRKNEARPGDVRLLLDGKLSSLILFKVGKGVTFLGDFWAHSVEAYTRNAVISGYAKRIEG